MFTGIDIQGRSLSIRDPTQKLKLQLQQLAQGQILEPIQQREGLPCAINGSNQIGINNTQQTYQKNGSIQNANQGLVINQITNQQLMQICATKQSQKYNLPINNQQQYKIGHQAKLDFMRQQQAQRHNQFYQIDTQLQQQQQMFQQQQYVQNLQLQKQQQISQSQTINNGENNEQLYSPYTNNGKNNNVLQQYLSGQKQMNINQFRENYGQNTYHTETSPKTTSTNFSNENITNTLHITNTLRNQNISQQQNDSRFQLIQQIQNNPQSQYTMTRQSSSQQPVFPIPNYFNKQQSFQNNHNQFNGQQQIMNVSSENISQKNNLYLCSGNPNNPYNSYLNNPYLQEKRYYKTSKLPKIRKQNGQQVTLTDIHSVSFENQGRQHLTTTINEIVNLNESIGVIQQNTNNENPTYGKSLNKQFREIYWTSRIKFKSWKQMFKFWLIIIKIIKFDKHFIKCKRKQLNQCCFQPNKQKSNRKYRSL